MAGFKALLGLALISVIQGQMLPRMAAQFHLKQAAFIEIWEKTHYSNDTANYADRYNMFLTTFNPFAFYIHDPVYEIPAPGKLLSSNADGPTWEASLKKMGGRNTAYWPNYPVRLPYELGGFDGIVQTSGFLVPGHEYGQLEVYNTEEGNEGGPWNIAAKAEDGGDWSYHWVIFKDVDGDGLLDVMAARFHVSLTGSTNSQLIWLQNPGGLTPDDKNKEWSSGWRCHIIYEAGPDVRIENRVYAKPDGTKFDVIMGAELWNQQLGLYYVEDKPGAWNFSFPNSPDIKRLILDKYDGQPFEANFMDLNNDGVEEIVVSYYDVGLKKGQFVAYQLTDPDNWDTVNGWTKRVIRGDFLLHDAHYSKGDMTPGKHRLFYPSKEYESTHNKPYIFLAGDDNGNHYILSPKDDDDKDNWEYNMSALLVTGGKTTGTMGIADIDGDGYTDIVAAGYTAGQVYVYTYAPL